MPATFTETHRGIARKAHTCPVDAYMAAGGYLSRNWGDYGYRIGYAGQFGTPDKPYLFACSCSDGSEFYLVSDRWGNVEQWQDES